MADKTRAIASSESPRSSKLRLRASKRLAWSVLEDASLSKRKSRGPDVVEEDGVGWLIIPVWRGTKVDSANRGSQGLDPLSLESFCHVESNYIECWEISVYSLPVKDERIHLPRARCENFVANPNDHGAGRETLGASGTRSREIWLRPGR